MWFLFPAMTAFVFLCRVAPTQAYLIDPVSCSGGNYQLDKSMVEQAFTMANLASSAVKTDPIDPNVAWLMQQLFNQEGKIFDVGETNNKGQTPGILVFEKEVTGISPQILDNVNEVVIFCDEKRLQPRKGDPSHLFDPIVGEAVSSDKACGGFNFMYTQNFVKWWDIIQVCPWFLKYASTKKFHTKASLSSLRASPAVAGLDKLITNTKYTPIDLMSLWDKAMLHEMMHTIPAGPNFDVNEEGGYGWKNCKSLAGDGRGLTNVDSWALFASALYWFGQGSPIDENGTFLSEAT